MGDRLIDCVAVVTGAGNGIGQSIAVGMAKEGADVCILDVDSSGLNTTARLVEEKKRKAVVIHGDVSQSEVSKHVVSEAVNQFGKIDILVNNAAIVRYAPFLEYTIEDWRRTIDINLSGYFFMAQAVARQMVLQKKGKIVNISSVAAEIAVPNSVAYSSTKGGVAALTRILAIELAPWGINVNAIGPGPILTKMIENTLSKEDRLAREVMIPLGRYGLPADLMGPVIFLASEDSNFVTGQTLYVDGGFIISGVVSKK